MREWAAAEGAYVQVMGHRRGNTGEYLGAMAAQIAQGSFERAESTLALFGERLPEHPDLGFARSNMAFARGDYDEAAARVRDLEDRNLGSLAVRADIANALALLALHAGRLAEADRRMRDRIRVEEERGVSAASLSGAIDLAWLDVWWREPPGEGLRQVAQALERHPLDSMPPADRPYLDLARLYARAGRLPDARRFVAQFEETVDPAIQRTTWDRHWVAGEIAVAEGRPRDALPHFQQWGTEVIDVVYLAALPHMAEAYDLADEADSAIAYYEQYLNTPLGGRQVVDAFWRARTYGRLGELYEARGDTAKAVEYYNAFVELWQDADPELQPAVRDVRAWMASLVAER
jgi:tetratricopeptide (TPR) repeat protein